MYRQSDWRIWPIKELWYKKRYTVLCNGEGLAAKVSGDSIVGTQSEEGFWRMAYCISFSTLPSQPQASFVGVPTHGSRQRFLFCKKLTKLDGRRLADGCVFVWGEHRSGTKWWWSESLEKTSKKSFLTLPKANKKASNSRQWYGMHFQRRNRRFPFLRGSTQGRGL